MAGQSLRVSFPLEHPDDERFYIQNVEPLIVGVEQQGSTLEFRFQCPLTDYEISARIVPGGKPVQEASKPGLYGLLENALRPSAGTSDLQATADYPLDQIEEAACDAFESVSQEFLWDGTRWTHWEADDRVIQFLIYSEALESFEPNQKKVLRQVLEAVAVADGAADPSERKLLRALLGSEGATPTPGRLPSVEELRSLKTRTQACAVICFGYAVACVDGELSQGEDDLLSVVCSTLGLGMLKQWELKRIAQSFVIDEAFSKIAVEGKPSNEERIEVYKFGLGLGLSKDEVRELEWRFLKRAGF